MGGLTRRLLWGPSGKQRAGRGREFDSGGMGCDRVRFRSVCGVCVCVYVRYMHNIHYTYMNITYGIEKLSMHLFCDINICLSFLTM